MILHFPDQGMINNVAAYVKAEVNESMDSYQ